MAFQKLKLPGICASFFATLCMLLLTSPVRAMGLGDIELRSVLNEPLRAEIELSNIGDLDEDQILISLASLEDYDRVGVIREHSHTKLRFKIEISGNSRDGKILVTTRDKIVEP